MQVCSIKWNTCAVNISIKKLLWKRKRNKKRHRQGKTLAWLQETFLSRIFPLLSFSLFLQFCCWLSFPSESLLHNLFPPLSLVWPSVWPSLPPFSLWAFNSSSAVKYFQPRIHAGEQRTSLVTEHGLLFLGLVLCAIHCLSLSSFTFFLSSLRPTDQCINQVTLSAWQCSGLHHWLRCPPLLPPIPTWWWIGGRCRGRAPHPWRVSAAPQGRTQGSYVSLVLSWTKHLLKDR